MTYDLVSLAAQGLGPSSVQGLNPQVQAALARMVAAMPAGIRGGLRINSGFRSERRQAELFSQAVQKYGSEQAARRWVAPPGRSQHNHGMAVDLGFGSPEVKDWVRQNAGAYGLTFPMAHEPWHIELAGGRSGGGQPQVTQTAENVSVLPASNAVNVAQTPNFNPAIPVSTPEYTRRPGADYAAAIAQALSGPTQPQNPKSGVIRGSAAGYFV